jgi:hypothetical protein
MTPHGQEAGIDFFAIVFASRGNQLRELFRRNAHGFSSIKSSLRRPFGTISEQGEATTDVAHIK